MTRTIFDDLFEINREMNRILNQGRFTSTAAWPETNIYESKDDYILVSKVPGMEKKDIDITIRDNTLTIAGKREKKYADARKQHLNERFAGEFQRSFMLNEKVDVDKIKAEADNGLLMVRVPKSPEIQPKKIEIK